MYYPNPHVICNRITVKVRLHQIIDGWTDARKCTVFCWRHKQWQRILRFEHLPFPLVVMALSPWDCESCLWCDPDASSPMHCDEPVFQPKSTQSTHLKWLHVNMYKWVTVFTVFSNFKLLEHVSCVFVQTFGSYMRI